MAIRRSARAAETKRRRGLTLVEVLAIVAALAALGTFVLPRLLDWRDAARASADAGVLGAIQTSLLLSHHEHRVSDAPAPAWIDDVSDIPAVMPAGDLPAGVTIVGAQVVDARGNRYDLVAETLDDPARLQRAGGGGS